MENEAISWGPFLVEISWYCDVNRLEIVQESLNMGQIAGGGDMEGNSFYFLSGSSELLLLDNGQRWDSRYLTANISINLF